MNIQPLISGITCLFLAHIMAFFQLNSQFKWGWFKEHEWVMALMGIPISLLYIWGTKYTVQGLDGLLELEWLFILWVLVTSSMKG